MRPADRQTAAGLERWARVMLGWKKRRRRMTEQLFRRLDRAADAVNPVLMLLAIGLAMLDLIVAGSLLPSLHISSVSPRLPACLSAPDRSAPEHP